MGLNWTDKRREFRFQLKGSFQNVNFALGSKTVSVEPIDISRSGLGLVVDETWDLDEHNEVKLVFIDARPPVTLQVRFRVQERDAETLQARTRCGLELSERDKHRGVDLIALLAGTPTLRLLCA